MLRSGVALCALLASCDSLPSKPSNPKTSVRLDQYDRAIAECDRVLERNPRDARACYERALLYYNKGEYDKAWQDVQRAQSLGYQVPAEVLGLFRETSQPNR